METTVTTQCLRRHGFIILLLVIFVSSVSCFDSKINASYNARDMIKIHNDRKRVLSSSNSGGLPQPYKMPLCVQKPGPLKIMPIFCGGGYILSEIKFADYGQPTGDCEKTFKRGNCGAGAPATLRLVKKNCLGKEECWFPVTDEMFGPTHCKGPVRIVILGTCTKKK